MNVTNAIINERELHVVVDGRRLVAFETKYTILELGHAVYLTDDVEENWLRANGDTIPADPENGRSELPSGSGMLITCNPVLFALCYWHWWTMNGKDLLPRGVPIAIPTTEEGIKVLRTREILNEWNQKWREVAPRAALGEL